MGKKSDTPELNSLTDEDWELLKSQEGLIVVDVYAKWAGPCTLMRPDLSRIGKIDQKVTNTFISIHLSLA